MLVVIGVNRGHREVIAVDEGMREDAASWELFFRGMAERGITPEFLRTFGFRP